MKPRRAHPDSAGQKGRADDDVEYFARAMADVVRVAPDPRGRVRAVPPISAPRAAHASQDKSGSPPVGGHAINIDIDIDEDAADAANAGFAAPGVDRRELRKLKRGDHVPGDRLDLHGMTSADAIERAARFIDSARGRYRCVAIVHGRGLHSAGQVAILKTRVRECLRQHRAVLAYADAPRSDGGSGAVYVLLRNTVRRESKGAPRSKPASRPT